MSVRGILGGVFASVAVVIIGWQVGATATEHATTATNSTGSSTGTADNETTGTNGSATGSSGASGSSSSDDASAGTSPSSSGLKDGTYTGTTQETRYGQVQVSVTVSGGKITDVSTPKLEANDGRSEEINSRAVPVLKEEVLASQSAQVETVSGATYTSEGYLTSLQAALDQAS